MSNAQTKRQALQTPLSKTDVHDDSHSAEAQNQAVPDPLTQCQIQQSLDTEQQAGALIEVGKHNVLQSF